MIQKILENLIKMLTNRKFLNPDNLEDNYKKLLKQNNEERIYSIKSDYSDVYYHVMIILGKLTTIKKIQGLDIFLEKSKNHKKIFIGDDINQKAYKQFKEIENTEVFFNYELLINIIDHELQPIKFELLTDEQKQIFINSYDITDKKKMAKMLSTDPIARYYNAKHNDIFKIYRPSPLSGISFSYRLVIESPVSSLYKKI